MNGTVFRPLGTFERIADAVAARRPYQYCLVAHLDTDPGVDAVRGALTAVQRSHPMLRAEVTAGDDGQPVFREIDRPIPIENADRDAEWTRVAAEQVAQWIHPDRGPLLRAVRIPASDGTSRIGLTVCHAATDGMGALRVLADFTRALDGQDLPTHPFPAAQESFAGSVRDASPGRDHEAGGTPGMPDDPREPSPFRPFDGTPASVTATALTVEHTAALLDVAHSHGTTLQPVFCAAAATVLGHKGRDLVNVGTAFDLRRAASLPDDVADRFLGAHTITRDTTGANFWDLVRSSADGLAAGTAPSTVGAALTAMAAAGAISPDAADAGLRQDTHADVLITNLGLVQAPSTQRVHLLSVEPPVLVMHVQDEQILGALTSGGRLRLVLTGYDPVPGLLEGMQATLEAIADGRRP